MVGAGRVVPLERRIAVPMAVWPGSRRTARLELLQPHLQAQTNEDNVAQNGNGADPPMAQRRERRWEEKRPTTEGNIRILVAA
jgi:hypothetical protein